MQAPFRLCGIFEPGVLPGCKLFMDRNFGRRPLPQDGTDLTGLLYLGP
jgi:hypothetical protein